MEYLQKLLKLLKEYDELEDEYLNIKPSSDRDRAIRWYKKDAELNYFLFVPYNREKNGGKNLPHIIEELERLLDENYSQG